MSPKIAASRPLAIAFVFATITTIANAQVDAPNSALSTVVSNPEKMGHVLLDNGNVLFGSITKLGDQIIVKRDESSSVRLPGRRVRFISENLDGIYRFRVAHRFPSDLAQLQRDVQWSLRNGLTMRAAEDVVKARELAPADAKTIHLLRQVAAELKKQHLPRSQSAANSPATSGQQSSVRTVSYESTSSESTNGSVDGKSPATESDHPTRQASEGGLINQSIANHFSARVQPVLMNRCVTCHADVPENQTSLRLRTAIESTWAPKQVAQDNLNAVLQFIDRQAPLDSLLRIKATDGHGGAKKSFGAPGSAMLRNLDRWLLSLQGPEMPELGPAPQPAFALPQFSMETGQATPDLDDRADMANDVEMPKSGIRRMPEVDNPFDPEIFNRRFGRD